MNPDPLICQQALRQGVVIVRIGCGDYQLVDAADVRDRADRPEHERDTLDGLEDLARQARRSDSGLDNSHGAHDYVAM
jgi:hypothetical protein